MCSLQPVVKTVCSVTLRESVVFVMATPISREATVSRTVGKITSSMKIYENALVSIEISFSILPETCSLVFTHPVFKDALNYVLHEEGLLFSSLNELVHEKTGENKGTDQLYSNCTADQHLCFGYMDRTISPFIKNFKVMI